MSGGLRSLALATFAVAVCACTSQTPARGLAPSAPSPIDVRIAQAANAVPSWIGKTRAEVLGALGPATVIRFESGYEVWLYRYVDPASRAAAERDQQAVTDASELVMLFAPSGVVSRARVRSPVQPSKG